MKLTTGVNADGRILGVHADFIMDGGAYTSLGIATAYYAGAMLTLTYDFENYRFDMYRVYTNLPACGAQRGHGAPQPRYAFEAHLDNVAKDLGIDPIEIRLRNARKPNTITPNEFVVNSCEMVACLEQARDVSGWADKKGKLPAGRGIGVATGSFVSGAGYPIYRTDLPQAAAMIKVGEDGTAATLYTGATDIGQGSDTVLCQMAAEAMGYTYEQMKIVASDTETTPHDFGAYASRQTLMSGAAVKEAGEEVKKQLLEMAGELLDLPPEQLDVRLGTISAKDNPETTLTFEEVARTFFVKKGPLMGRGSYAPPKYGRHVQGRRGGNVAGLQLRGAGLRGGDRRGDGRGQRARRVGRARLRQVINPALLHAQVHGALYMGMGESIWEEVRFDAKGKIQNPTWANIACPRLSTCPAYTRRWCPATRPPAPGASRRWAKARPSPPWAASATPSSTPWVSR